MVAFFVVAPFVVYPLFLMKALCFALYACAFNLLIGYVGLLFLLAYVSDQRAKRGRRGFERGDQIAIAEDPAVREAFAKGGCRPPSMRRG